LDFAVKVAVDSGAIGDADFPPLREHGFSDEDIWDIAAIAAFFALSNRLANFTSMPPNDEFYLMGRLPKEKKPEKKAEKQAVGELRAAQGRQADAAGVEAAIDRKRLAVHVARCVAAEKHDCGGDLVFGAVAIERDGVVVAGADGGRVHLLRHRGVDRAGGNRVHADARIAELGGLLAREVHERRLARAVGHSQRARPQARDRGDVDDRAAARAQHDRRAGLGAQERSVEVDRHHMPPFLVRGVEDGLEDGDPGVVDECVDAPGRLHDAGDGRGDGRRLDDVALDVEAIAAALSALGTVDVERRDAVALVQKAPGDRETYPAGRSGDDGNLVLVPWDDRARAHRSRKAASATPREARATARAAAPRITEI